MTPLTAAITMDVDSLQSIYKGQGNRRAEGYTHAEMRMGLETFARFLEPYQAKTTLFLVGKDLEYFENVAPIKAMVAAGHEAANHTYSHAQGFRLLPSDEKEKELEDMETVCRDKLGINPVGFRSPGWNIGDDALPILKRRGYLYDSSVFPTSIMPLLKLMHWYTMRERSKADRTTMGQFNYLFVSPMPYHTGLHSLAYKGKEGIVEIPLTVTPGFRLPFFATFLVSTGLTLFQQSLRALRKALRPIQFQFHLSDFVDYNHPDLADQVPLDGQGQYVPYALRMPLEEKMSMFRVVMDAIAENYTFITLENWANRFIEETRS